MPLKESDKERLKHFFDKGDPDEIFILEEEIASGSFGAVYKGRHTQNGKYYAVKIITPEEDEVLEDFMVEISVLRKCKHENIVGFSGSWLKGEEIFIAMELCDGGAVSDIFQVSQDPLTEDQIALITRESLKALAYLHSIGIIHRDIKGANILLTNDGDIKLVDFGVSAELKHPGDRRNTLIGTPYWMAPEVISNKTGNCPYDQKADLWSLGITLLELAERNPPLHEIHPMKALMMIPMRDAPSFAHPEAWGKDFKDFVAQCLIKQPEKRKTAEEMLKHPFVTNAKTKQILVDLVSKRRKLEAKIRAEEDQEEDSSDIDSSSDEEDEAEVPSTPSTPQPKSAPPSAPSTPQVDKLIQSANGKRISMEVSKEQNSPGWQPKKPSNPQQRSNSSYLQNSTPSVDEKKHEKSDTDSEHSFQLDSPGPQRRATKRGTQRSNIPQQGGNPNRPTYRTNRKLTKREIKNHEKNLINRQLMKQQLKELRAQQQNHLNQLEKQQKQHQKEQETLSSKFNSVVQSKQKQIAKDLDSMQRKHKTESENFSKNFSNNHKNLQKQHQTLIKSTTKAAETESKKHEKEFRDKIKEQNKEKKNELKDKSRSLSKKDAKALKMEHEFLLGWQDLIFSQKQARSLVQIEYEKKFQLLEDQSKYEKEQLERKLQLQWDHVEQQHQFLLENLQQSNQFELEQMQQQQPLEFKHMQEKHELEKVQLNEYIGVEDKQQKQLLTSELKSQLQEFKKGQQKDQRVLVEQLKQLPKQFKNLGKKELKQKETELKQQLHQKLAKETAEFNEKQSKQRAEEEDLIKTSQQVRREMKRQEHEEQTKKLKEDHESQLRKLQETHAQSLVELKEKHRKEKQELLEEQQKSVKENQEHIFKQFEDLTAEYQAVHTKILDEHHNEQVQYKSKGSSVEELSKLRGDQEDEKKHLISKLQKDRDAFSQKCESERQVLSQDLATHKKKTEETGRREAFIKVEISASSSEYPK